MEEFPSNSRQKKAPSKYTRPTASPKTSETSEVAKPQKVVVGEVTRRKPSLGKRFSQTFFGGDAQSVMGYVMLDVLIPAAKDMIADAITQGVERKLWGEPRSTRRSGHRPGYTAYNRAAAVYKPDPRTAAPRALTPQARATHSFNEVVLQTRPEAEAVINSLFDRIEEYQTVSVADLYDMLGVTSNWMDRNWGWVDLSNADVKRIREGYLLDLPKPVSLD